MSSKCVRIGTGVISSVEISSRNGAADDAEIAVPCNCAAIHAGSCDKNSRRGAAAIAIVIQQSPRRP
ncbi:hypothetical protein D3C87_2065170 [compost metagenome]